MRIDIRCVLRHAEHERKEFYIHHTFSRTHNHNLCVHISLLEETWRSNKRISTHYNSMRNLEFIKSKNTNSQTLCNTEELQEWEGCTFQLAQAVPKVEATDTLNWNTFLMRRLTLQKTPAILPESFFRRFTKSSVSPGDPPDRLRHTPTASNRGSKKDFALLPPNASERWTPE